MKKCTQCEQILSDDTKFCFKCGGSNYEPVEDAGGTDQQPPQQSYYAQPAQPVQPPGQPSYYTSQPAKPAQAAPQPSYYTQQPAYQPQPAYQQPVNNGTVSVGMNFLFIFLSFIPIVNLIFAIIVAASSGFKKSYQNLARAWLIFAAIMLVISIISYFLLRDYYFSIFEELFGYYGF